MSAASVEPRAPLAKATDRIVLGLLLVLLAAGSLALWIAVPVGCWRLAWRLGHTNGDAFLIALPMTVAAMIAAGSLLVWVNRLYLRVSGVIARYEAEEEVYGRGSAPRFLRGPLEPLLLGSLLVAIAALVVWFLLFAHSFNPSTSVAP